MPPTTGLVDAPGNAGLGPADQRRWRRLRRGAAAASRTRPLAARACWTRPGTGRRRHPDRAGRPVGPARADHQRRCPPGPRPPDDHRGGRPGRRAAHHTPAGRREHRAAATPSAAIGTDAEAAALDGEAAERRALVAARSEDEPVLFYVAGAPQVALPSGGVVSDPAGVLAIAVQRLDHDLALSPEDVELFGNLAGGAIGAALAAQRHEWTRSPRPAGTPAGDARAEQRHRTGSGGAGDAALVGAKHARGGAARPPPRRAAGR